jgi:ribosomal protein L6P/L9E
MPIAVPAGAEVAISAAAITVKGPLGVLTQSLNGLVKVENNAGTLSFDRRTTAAKPTPCPVRCAHWSTTW